MNNLVYVYKFNSEYTEAIKVSEFSTEIEANAFISTQKDTSHYYFVNMEIK